MPSVTLQPVQESSRAPQRAPSGPKSQGDARILLVEDEPLTAEVFARALSRDGHRVEVARDGLQALRSLHEGAPDLVVLDMSLPALPGSELVRRLREEGHVDLPIVVVSGSSPVESDLLPAQLHPGLWLCKPLKPRELVRVVREFLRAEP
jgi:DNA-binding response OmpR family regulator